MTSMKGSIGTSRQRNALFIDDTAAKQSHMFKNEHRRQRNLQFFDDDLYHGALCALKAVAVLLLHALAV